MKQWQVQVFMIVSAETAEEAGQKVTEVLMCGEIDFQKHDQDILSVEVGVQNGEEPTEVPEHLRRSESCSLCDGTGYVDETGEVAGEAEECGVCYGRGKVITPA